MLPTDDQRPIVLFVDDCSEQRDFYEFALRDRFRIVTASRGDEALMRAASDVPNAIVLDVMMPGMDGWEVCRRLKARPETAGIPVIMLTASHRENLSTISTQAGAAALLTKPCREEELLAAITAAMNCAQ